MKNFGDLEEKYASYEDANILLVPIPFDGTSTYGKGSDKGPEAIIASSKYLELYDIETDSEVFRKGIHITQPINENSNPEKLVQEIEKSISNYLQKEKFITILGGEHSISIGVIRAFRKKFKELTVLQLDAHSDLRPEYNGSIYNHACSMHESSKKDNLIQVGIRSMDSTEISFIDDNFLFTSYKIRNNKYWKEDIINCLGKNVYITIDLDFFDPSIMPSTGTPEPGGFYWNETLEFLKMVFINSNVVGFDIVELSPIHGLPAPDFMAAKLYYKLLSYKFHLKSCQKE